MLFQDVLEVHSILQVENVKLLLLMELMQEKELVVTLVEQVLKSFATTIWFAFNQFAEDNWLLEKTVSLIELDVEMH